VINAIPATGFFSNQVFLGRRRGQKKSMLFFEKPNYTKTSTTKTKKKKVN